MISKLWKYFNFDKIEILYMSYIFKIIDWQKS